MKKQPDIYYDKASGYTKAIIYYKNNTFIGEAQCHPEDEDIIRCTEKGLDLNNTVLCDFM